MERAEYWLKNDEKLARYRNSECLKWVKNSFEKSFQEYKSWSSTLKENRLILEKSIEENFVKIESQIELRSGKRKLLKSLMIIAFFLPSLRNSLLVF